jgi:hypothetical protein
MTGCFFSRESVDGGAITGGTIRTILSLLPRGPLIGSREELDGCAFDLKGDRFAAAVAGGSSTTLAFVLWRGWRVGFGAVGIGAWLIIGVDWLK